MMRSLLVFGCLLFAGCNLYFGGDDQPPCNYADDIAVQELRNPQTGQCEAQGCGGGGCGCGVGPTNTGGAPAAQLNWAGCYSSCDSLDEHTCLATAGCRAQYTGFACPPGVDCLWSGIQFQTCAATAPSGPIEGGDCWGLDAQTCSEHDDCATTYQQPVDGASQFSFNQCIPEPSTVGACAAVDCGPGSHCETQCSPCDKANPTDPCMTQCQAVCVPDQNTCATVKCAAGYHCEDSCTGTGTGTGSAQACPAGAPCPITCVPQCLPDAPATCESLTSEAACIMRTDCTPIYDGVNCTCDPSGVCTCEQKTFARCETDVTPTK